MRIRNALIGAVAAVGLAGGGAAMIAAQSASAVPPPPPVVIHSTSVQVASHHIGPFTLSVDDIYVAAPTGFAEAAVMTEICVGVPHLNPPHPTTVTAICSFTAVSTLPGHPRLFGNAALDELGQVGHITGGTGIDNHAHGTFASVNLAPKVAADTLVFVP